MEELTHTPGTRERLLDAAGEVFAEEGFRAATVRDICRRAKANVAAVNYHFGDKESLYVAVLNYAHGCAIQKYPPTMGLAEDAPAEQRLHAFVLAFLLRILDHGRPAWQSKLITREMVEATPALDVLVEQAIRPQFTRLSGIVRELLGQEAQEQQVGWCVSSIVGQCLFYHFARHVLARLMPRGTLERQDIDRLARQVTDFSLAGLKAAAGHAEGAPR